jgi:hypothetical protein
MVFEQVCKKKIDLVTPFAVHGGALTPLPSPNISVEAIRGRGVFYPSSGRV